MSMMCQAAILAALKPITVPPEDIYPLFENNLIHFETISILLYSASLIGYLDAPL